jgi:hypothetical protein
VLTQTEVIAIVIIWCGTGFAWSMVYIGMFLYWLVKTKHEISFNFKLIFKWIAITAPIQILVSAILFFFDESLLLLMMPAFYLATQPVAYILYRLGIIKKYELHIPLAYWAPGIIHYLYKKHQLALAIDDSRKARG